MIKYNFKNKQEKLDQVKMQKSSHSKIGRRQKTGRKYESSQQKQSIKTVRTIFPNAKSILCVGSRHENEVKSMINLGLNAIGIDVTESKSKLLKKVDAHEIEKKFLENEFDLGYASHSLEHMHTPEIVLKGLRKVCKQGLIIILPGYENDEKPTANHCSYFDFEVNSHWKKDLEQVKNDSSFLKDFKDLEPYELKYYKWGKEFENEKSFEIILMLEFK